MLIIVRIEYSKDETDDMWIEFGFSRNFHCTSKFS